MIDIRTFEPDELPRYAALCRHMENWTETEIKPEQVAWMDRGSAWGLFHNGEPVSGLRNIPFRQSVRGVEKRMGGIAGVVTHPQYRRQGHIRRLMAAAFSDMREKGQVVSSLHPFKERFYAAFGYISSNANLRVEIPAKTLSHHMETVRHMAEDDWEVEVKPMIETRDDVYAFQRDVVLPHHTGYTIDPDRLPATWKARSRDVLVVFVRCNGRTEALARYLIKNDTLYVEELHWRSLAARSHLLAYLAVYADQTPIIWLRNLPLGSNVQEWLCNAPRELTACLSPQPLMVRVMDPIQALTDLPAATAGDMVFALRDEQCAWNNGVYRATALDGKLAVTQEEGTSELELTIEGLSALVYGVFPVEEIAFRGWITGLNDERRRLLAQWFPPRLLFNVYHF